ncbi:MAG: hypothetical protein H0W88_00635 [Parachlamydiaceae bacterium]|nr:hypothetical protein [Parachlamydiaceae bacterium]
MHINSEMLNHIKLGHSIVIEKGVLRLGNWKDTLSRLITWKKDSNQDKKIAELLIKQLSPESPRENYKETLAAATQFTKSTCRTNSVYKRLENVVFAHKCEQILSIQSRRLVQNDGTALNPFFSILKNNFLHYVIAKANERDKETAILIKDDEIFIRAKKGKDFLDEPDSIEMILHATPSDHPERPFLRLLRREMLKKNPSQEKITEYRSSLSNTNYRYLPLNKIPTDKKGVLKSHAYLANGLEKHDGSKWKEVKTAFIEESKTPGYKLRVITRLPEYAFSKTWIGFIKCVFKNILNFRAHGHSWVELVEPMYDKSKQFTGKQKVIDIGYYFHPLDSKKRYQNADPMSYMPIPKDQLIVEEIDISKNSFRKGVKYLNQVQAMLRKPNRKLADVPQDPSLSQIESEKIRSIYQMTIKSTCLGFANSFKKALTGIETDDRGSVRKFVFSNTVNKVLDRLDVLLDKTFFLKTLMKPVHFFTRMELPYWVKNHVFQKKDKPKTVEINPTP